MSGAPTSATSTHCATSAGLPNAWIWIAFMVALSTDGRTAYAWVEEGRFGPLDFGILDSPQSAIAFPPAPSMAFTTDAAASAPFEYVIATLAPSAARRFAIAAPMPRDRR